MATIGPVPPSREPHDPACPYWCAGHHADETTRLHRSRGSLLDVGHVPGSEGYCVQVWTEMAGASDPAIRMTGLDDEVRLSPEDAREVASALGFAAMDTLVNFPRSSPPAVASADTAQRGAVPVVNPRSPGLSIGAGPRSAEPTEAEVSGDDPPPAGAEAPAGGDAVDPDDTSRCPLGPCCETCDGSDDLAVATAGTPLGIVCLTLCGECAGAGALPKFTAAGAMYRCLDHAEHLGCTVDDLAVTDPR